MLHLLVLRVAVLLLPVCQALDARETNFPSDLFDGKTRRPVIAFDQGHNNWGNPEDFQVMRDYLTSNGFEVAQSTALISGQSLRRIDVFHTSNALASINVDNWSLPTPSAFTPKEITTLLEWVREGGALLIAIEHMPFAGAYEALADALGISLSNGFALDANMLQDYSSEAIAAAGSLQFSRNGESLSGHPLVDGPAPYHRVEFLATDTGSAFRLPEGGISLANLGPGIISLEPKVSWEFDEETPRRDVSGWSQAGIMEVGKGRVAIIGDNYLISAPAFLEPPYVEDDTEVRLGANNHRFTLNLYRWLTGQ